MECARIGSCLRAACDLDEIFTPSEILTGYLCEFPLVDSERRDVILKCCVVPCVIKGRRCWQGNARLVLLIGSHYVALAGLGM